MTKSIYILGLAALALTASCGNDEMVEAPTTESNNNAIAFANACVDKSTRGIDDDITTDNLANFSVYGYMDQTEIYANEPVTKVDGAWTHPTVRYWETGKPYTFTAIAPAVDPNWQYTPTDVNGGTIHFDNAEGRQDLLYAYKSLMAQNFLNRSAVSFTFKHLLSRVKFKFTNALSNDAASFKVTNVQITDAYKSGDIELSKGTIPGWNLTDAETYAIDFVGGTAETTQIAQNKTASTDHKYMIPYPGDKSYLVSFDLELYQYNELIATYHHKDLKTDAITMESGYSYLFEVRFTDGPNGNITDDGTSITIELVGADVVPWDEFEGESASEQSNGSDTLDDDVDDNMGFPVVADDDDEPGINVNPDEDGKYYIVKNIQWWEAPDNSYEMQKNTNGTYSYAWDGVCRFAIAYVVEGNISKLFGNTTTEMTYGNQIEMTGSYTLTEYAYDLAFSNWIDPVSQTDANTTLTFNPATNKLTTQAK